MPKTVSGSVARAASKPASKPAASKRLTSQPCDKAYSTLRIAVDGRIATITLNRPERLNGSHNRRLSFVG